MAGAVVWAQAGTAPFRSRVDIVQVTVSVTDANGRLITGLTQGDFQIFEDGVEQQITQFTDQRVPVSLGMLLDASDSMRGQPVVDARDAFDRFVGDLLLREDEVFVATFNHLAAAGHEVDDAAVVAAGQPQRVEAVRAGPRSTTRSPTRRGCSSSG